MTRLIPTSKAIIAIMPIVLLGLALLALLFHAIPPDNKDLLTAIISGLLGFLSRPAPERQKDEPAG